MAPNRAEWNTLTGIFIRFVETQVVRADTRATLARDDIATREAEM